MVKISRDDFNRDLSRYISSRRTFGKPIHIQVRDFLKDTKKSVNSFRFTKAETEEYGEPVEIMIEEKPDEDIVEEDYEDLDELDEEIKEERRPFWSFLTNAFKSQSPREKEQELMEESDEPKIQVIEKLEEEYEELDDMEDDLEDLEDEIEEKKEGIFRRVTGIFKKESSEEVVKEAPGQYTLNDDIKDTLKILTEWIKKLPPEKLEQFKNSEDFAKMKETLKKYKLIKSQ